jgi:hypothetical protein
MNPNNCIYIILFICLLASNIQAQKTCISGDCINGFGVALKQHNKFRRIE